MKKVVKYLSIIICTFIISISYVKAASYDVSVTSNTVTVGNSITLTIKGNDLAGKFTLSSSNSGVASLSGSSLWIDNNSQSVTISTSNAGTAVITITPTDVTSYDGNTITGNKTVTITVNSKPTSNPSNGGNKTGTTTTPKPTKKKSSNNNLSSLTIEDHNLDKEFKKEVTEYSVVVENDVKKIKINAQLDDSSAKVEGTGEVEVKEGNNKIEIKKGEIYESYVNSIDRSIDGRVGSKNANINYSTSIGEISKNTSVGLFGKYTSSINKETIPVAKIDEVLKGKAMIYTVTKEKEINTYEIEITNINKSLIKTNKCISFKITDKKLLEEAGGVVQGMSGSPIIQNNKIIGSVTHVVVNDVKTGYAVFIRTMLEEGEK